MPYEDIFIGFLECFKQLPCFMIYPKKIILEQEINCLKRNEEVKLLNISKAFIPSKQNPNYFKDFMIQLLSDEYLKNIIKMELLQLDNVVNEWKKQISQNKLDTKFYLKIEKATIIKDIISDGFDIDNNIEIYKLPSMRIFEYSLFKRVHVDTKKIQKNDVADLFICTAIPYMDAVITEKHQGQIYREAKKIIPQMKELEIFCISDIK